MLFSRSLWVMSGFDLAKTAIQWYVGISIDRTDLIILFIRKHILSGNNPNSQEVRYA